MALASSGAAGGDSKVLGKAVAAAGARLGFHGGEEERAGGGEQQG